MAKLPPRGYASDLAPQGPGRNKPSCCEKFLPPTAKNLPISGPDFVGYFRDPAPPAPTKGREMKCRSKASESAFLSGSASGAIKPDKKGVKKRPNFGSIFGPNLRQTWRKFVQKSGPILGQIFSAFSRSSASDVTKDREMSRQGKFKSLFGRASASRDQARSKGVKIWSF